MLSERETMLGQGDRGGGEPAARAIEDNTGPALFLSSLVERQRWPDLFHKHGLYILGVPNDTGTPLRNVDRGVLGLDLLRSRELQIHPYGVIRTHLGFPVVKVCHRGQPHLRRRRIGIPAESGDKMSLCLGKLHGGSQNHAPDHVKPTPGRRKPTDKATLRPTA